MGRGFVAEEGQAALSGHRGRELFASSSLFLCRVLLSGVTYRSLGVGMEYDMESMEYLEPKGLSERSLCLLKAFWRLENDWGGRLLYEIERTQHQNFSFLCSNMYSR